MERVLVTAGGGFIGQHFIKHLQLYGPQTLKEIRVVDGKPFQKLLEYKSKVAVKEFLGTVFDTAILEQALDGVDTVVHLYEHKDTSMVPDRKKLHRINVEGTRLIVDACRKVGGVKRFLFLSSSDIMLCNHIACDAYVSEMWVVPKGKWAYPDYCSSKYEAEKLVFACDTFQTFSVRPLPLYGELDDQEWGITAHLQMAKRFNGLIPVIGDRQGVLTHSYVGNAAYGMVKILDKMVQAPKDTKEAVAFTDDTPLIDFYSMVEPYAIKRNVKLQAIALWFMLIFIPYLLLEKFAHVTRNVYCFGLKPLLQKLPAARILYNYFYTYTTFNGFKALMYIGYKPIYSYEESVKNSATFYVNC